MPAVIITDSLVSDTPVSIQPPPPTDDFPVNSVFINTDGANPALVLGYGTWILIGSGQLALN